MSLPLCSLLPDELSLHLCIFRGHEQEQKLLVDVGGLNLLLDTIFIHPVNDDLFPSVVHSLACIIHSHATQSFEGHTNSDERRSRSNRGQAHGQAIAIYFAKVF